MANKSKKQQDDQNAELPEDKIDQNNQAESQIKPKRKTRRKSSASRKAKQTKVSKDAPEETVDEKKQQDDQVVELPEDRIDQLDKVETQDDMEKKGRRKLSASRKAKQAKASKDAPEEALYEKKQQENQVVELPEDRIGQLDKVETQEETEKKGRRKSSATREEEQPEASEDAPEIKVEELKLSKEDLLADIRQTLVSEEEVIEEKGFFSRIKDKLKNISKAKTKEDKPLPQPEVVEDVQVELPELEVEPKPKKKERSSTKQEEEAIKEFFADLEALADVVLDEVEQEAEPEEAEEELGKEVQRPKLPVRTDEKEDIDFDKVREVALQEYDDTYVEPEIKRKISLQEEVRETIREAKPQERILLTAVIVLVAGALLLSGIFVIANAISFPTPEPTVAVNWQDTVYPTRLGLPGGWKFPLGQGSVEEGEWAPHEAEWLIGTEISRWVALPWSLQLEAVLRTLTKDDQIELMMSNSDVLVFNVYSIQEMTMEQLLALDTKTPSLLVVLYNDEEADGTFWVVTAIP